MAGRKEKYTIDYFPHYVNHKKTMHIIEQKFGNDGYAFCFKLLELLGKSEHHIFDINTEENKLYFFSQVNVPEEIGIKVLELLYRLEAIDRDLYEKGFVFSQKFCDNVADAYRKRKSEVATKAEIVSIYSISSAINANNTAMNAQSKVEYSRVKESKEYNPEFEILWKIYERKGNKVSAFKQFKRLSKIDIVDIKEKIGIYVASTPDKKFRKDFERWLNPDKRHWEDEITKTTKHPKSDMSYLDLLEG